MSSTHERFASIAAFDTQFLRDLATINRLPETVGYNLAYVVIAVGTVCLEATLSNRLVLVAAFLAVND